MTTPADDCGVTGGCRACPLFTANVCGDPAPTLGDLMTEYERPFAEKCAERTAVQGPAWEAVLRAVELELPGMWESADFLGGAPDEVRPPARAARFEVDGAGVVTDRDDPWPGWDKPNGDPVPVCVQTPSGVVPCGSARLCRSPEEVAATRAAFGSAYLLVEPTRPDLRTPDEWSEVTGLVVLDPDGWRADGRPWSAPLTRADFLKRAMRSTLAKAPAVDPDAPDVDPAEPKPEGAGCCGGGCGA
ncbi:hypothetical protein [Micromonospora sp. NPDC047730]|uniref:hypothetical protein n=1 Tax=Micromonospora sp. NPDC047730 TaxID=3364253 RepID=UPI0037172700